jgi:hypothetical protein
MSFYIKLIELKIKNLKLKFMARTKQTARKTTGGMAPRKFLKPIPK